MYTLTYFYTLPKEFSYLDKHQQVQMCLLVEKRTDGIDTWFDISLLGSNPEKMVFKSHTDFYRVQMDMRKAHLKAVLEHERMQVEEVIATFS